MIANTYHTFVTYYAMGGFLMWPIFAVSLVSWFMGIEKLLFMHSFDKSRKTFLKKISAAIANRNVDIETGNEDFDSLLDYLISCNIKGNQSCSFTLLFREFLISAIAHMERGFSTMKVWISVAPLLGLLGTVIGMIHTFEIITKFGFGNPSLMAEGIRVALITPQAGLTVAFPMMMFHNYLVNRSKKTTAALLMDGESLLERLGSPKELAMLNRTKDKQRDQNV